MLVLLDNSYSIQYSVDDQISSKNLLSFRRAIHIDAVGEKAINCNDKFDSKKKIVGMDRPWTANHLSVKIGWVL